MTLDAERRSYKEANSTSKILILNKTLERKKVRRLLQYSDTRDQIFRKKVLSVVSSLFDLILINDGICSNLYMFKLIHKYNKIKYVPTSIHR